MSGPPPVNGPAGGRQEPRQPRDAQSARGSGRQYHRSRSLREQQESIEKELGEALDWRELPNRKSSSLRLSLKDVDPINEDDWPRQIEWMAATLTRFHVTFAPRIRGLAAAVQP
jgi:hypothetical protein